MIKNYLKTTLRHLWRHRLFTALNVLGLTIGISACWVIYRIVDYEFSYDSKLPNKERIYRVSTVINFDGEDNHYGGVSRPLARQVSELVPGIARATPVFRQHVQSAEISQREGSPTHFEDIELVMAVDSSYFEMVPYHWLAGSPAAMFSRHDNLVLTNSRAMQYFGDLPPEEILGRVVVHNDTTKLTIAGIVEDYPVTSDFIGKEFLVLAPEVYPLNAWTNTNGSDRLYLQLASDGDQKRISDAITSIVMEKWEEANQVAQRAFSSNRRFELIPINEVHFATQINDYPSRKASKPVLLGLIGVGIFLLALACINYINMSTAQIPQRSKEIGVRKTLGSSPRQLIGQFLNETLVVTLMAAVLACGLTELAFIVISDLVPPGVAENPNWPMLTLFLTGLVLLVTVMSSFYPAWLIVRVKTAKVLKGRQAMKMGQGNLTLRKGLIVFQFIIAQVFIIGALIGRSQLTYTLHKDLGFDKEAVITLRIPWKIMREDRYDAVKFTVQDQLRKEPGIQAVALGTEPMSSNYSTSSLEHINEQEELTSRHVHIKTIDAAYMDLYGMQLIAGTKHSSPNGSEYILNETAVAAFGFASAHDAVGKLIGQPGKKYPIVGVVKDFHIQDFHTVINPMVLVSNEGNLSSFNIKLNTLNPQEWQSTIARIERLWYGHYPPETFSYQFYDQLIESMYKQERNLAKLINIATGIAILISCLGLFGLATLTAFQRTKEIGIRKVLGATAYGIVAMLSKDFVRLVFIAIVIASPLAWWAMNKWLEDFAYRVEIQWWMFGLAGLGAILIALITVGYQAIRAALANPVNSLRDE